MVNETIYKYLEEGISKKSRKEAEAKIKKTIKSIDSKDQIKPVINMIVNYYKMYEPGPGFFRYFWDFIRGA